MLDSLYIKNYRNLKEFKIDSLDQINLITGKNNTGKSTILEAIAIYASKGDFGQIYQLLENRGEGFGQSDSKNILESNIRSLASMFTNRKVAFDKDNSIRIGKIGSGLFEDVSLRFVKYYDELKKNEQGEIVRRRRIMIDDNNHSDYDYKVGFEVNDNGSVVIPLDMEKPSRLGFRGGDNGEKFQFIRTGNIDRDINGKLFDNIALTEKEKSVVEALQIIEPKTERIAFITEGNSLLRNAVIKLSDIPEVLPLKSMGDGINRILTIILALVNCDNGYLLIDEFENGLHHTVQEYLWKIIFKLSKDLNIQVFATTHSEDCISGFESVLNSADNSINGKLIRLDNINGSIKQVEFSSKELKVANEQDIEIR